jgi:hypothetical protein
MRCPDQRTFGGSPRQGVGPEANGHADPYGLVSRGRRATTRMRSERRLLRVRASPSISPTAGSKPGAEVHRNPSPDAVMR